jgi:hypothetical protein
VSRDIDNTGHIGFGELPGAPQLQPLRAVGFYCPCKATLPSTLVSSHRKQ